MRHRCSNFILLTLAFIAGTNADPEVKAEVELQCGNVSGIWSVENNVYSFLGIPYASPPEGPLRWQPPVAVRKENNNCWKGVLDAKQLGSPCPQSDYSKNVIGSENCLFLNVITPTLNDSAKLPVMFWIHGGSLMYGKGDWYEFGYAPHFALANELNVVFVGINYRLNIFGFLALEMLVNSSATNTSGNYGFMDMIEGLKWVKENIHKFGGDPDQVTAFGQSSGGTSLTALLASPLSKGLFSKAWMSSASPILNKTASEAFKDNEIFLRNTGCNNVTCLYNLTPAEAIESIPLYEYPFWAMEDPLGVPEQGIFVGALAIVDGYVLQEAPLRVWAYGNGTDVPVLIGMTAQEVNFFPMPQGVLTWTWNTSDYKDHVTKKLETFNDIIPKVALSFYPENVSTPECQLATLVTDVRVTCGTNYLATVLAAGIKSNVYRYVATYYTEDQPANPYGIPFEVHCSYHGIDTLAFFKTMNTVLANGTGPRDEEWQDNVQREVMSFVRTGKPATAEWLPYPEKTAELNTDTRVSRCYHGPQCEFWLHNGFFSYNWIN